MRARLTFAVLLALVIGSITSLPRVCAEDSVEVTGTCGDQYNAYVGQAKAALVAGDRSGAIAGLIAAKSQLRLCEDQNSTTAVAVALNSPQSACIE